MESITEQNSINSRMPRTTKLLVVAAILLAVAYLLQAPSPLRLGIDSIILLSIGASVADGHGFLYHGEATHFPSGYPAMVAFLDHLGLASSRSFILLNCAFVCMALIACYCFYRNPLDLSPSLSLGLCCITMLSFVLVQFVTRPMSDVVFLGLFMLALLLITRVRDETGRTRWSWLGLAFLLTVLAITVRTAGVALLPAFAWVLGAPLLLNSDKLWKKRPIVLWGSLFSLLIFGLSCGFLISKTRYFAEMKALYFQAGLSGRLLKNLVMHSMEMGAIGFNVPTAKAPFFLKPAYLWVGMLMIGLIFRGIWLRRRSFGVLEVTLLAYGGLIFAWPYQDGMARFWLPALPLIAGFIALALIDAAKLRCFKFIGVAMCVWCILGLATIAHSTKVSWAAGTRYANVYSGNTLTYRAAYYLGQTNLVEKPDDAVVRNFLNATGLELYAVNTNNAIVLLEHSDAILLLRRYDPRAQRAPSHNGM
jgi:hypothetical protein